MPQVTPPGQSVRLFFLDHRPHGAPAGLPVVFLHGFPEFSYAWRRQLPALAAAGKRALAPDLRGYGRSPAPPRVRDYAIELLAGDVLELIRRECDGRAHVVGHDWGGVVAWWLAMHHPEAVGRLAVLNAPHPAAYLRELRRMSGQLLRSWYILFFQLPWLPERFIRSNDFAALRRLFRTDPARRRAFTADDIDQYVAAFSKPASLTAAINYYRAAFRAGPASMARSVRPVESPTLVIWGERDRYLVPQLAEGLGQWVPDVRVERLPSASHWVQHDEPERVNQLLIEFLQV
jgi:pimeloyl-ACP methyl ester carboxylesterase